jgi:hypothetical protein
LWGSRQGSGSSGNRAIRLEAPLTPNTSASAKRTMIEDRLLTCRPEVTVNE